MATADDEAEVARSSEDAEPAVPLVPLVLAVDGETVTVQLGLHPAAREPLGCPTALPASGPAAATAAAETVEEGEQAVQAAAADVELAVPEAPVEDEDLPMKATAAAAVVAEVAPAIEEAPVEGEGMPLDDAAVAAAAAAAFGSSDFGPAGGERGLEGEEAAAMEVDEQQGQEELELEELVDEREDGGGATGEGSDAGNDSDGSEGPPPVSPPPLCTAEWVCAAEDEMRQVLLGGTTVQPPLSQAVGECS